MFHEPSPRHLTVIAARALQAAVPPQVERVAVFQRPSQSIVDEVIDALRPDWLQADADAIAQLRLPSGQRVLPVLREKGTFSISRQSPTVLGRRAHEIENVPFSRVMLEGGTSGQGERADWTVARELAARCELVLAGGLDAANVAEAIRTVQPFGVDVSSGVEGARGVKDPVRIRAFIHAARAAEQAMTLEAAR